MRGGRRCWLGTAGARWFFEPMLTTFTVRMLRFAREMTDWLGREVPKLLQAAGDGHAIRGAPLGRGQFLKWFVREA